MEPTQTEIFETLHKRFHLSQFRHPQHEIITAIIDRKDVLALLPTGAGKSLCYQLPACVLPGITVVVSPLLSLINDQVTKLRNLKIAAAALTSQKSPRQQKLIRTALNNQKIKLLYLSPEKLMSKSWFTLLASLSVSLVVIDEAHCIAMWGGDFRPAYLQIKKFCDELPSRPIIAAFTATATQETARYITRVLNQTAPVKFQLSTRKPHLQIAVQQCHHQIDKLITLISYLSKEDRLPAIVYCATRSATTDLAQWLNIHFIPFYPKLQVAAYHGGLSTDQRIKIEKQFISNQIEILIATNAFGMGVDKPNTRTVIHWQIPASIENFYQEIGRAGRDLKPALSVLCYSHQDIATQQRICVGKAKTKNRQQQQLAQLVHLLNTQQCINQQLEHYFSDPKSLPPCARCSECVSIQPLNQQQFQLAQNFVYFFNRQTTRIPTPIAVIELLTILKPIRYDQLLLVPGIGVGWLKKYAALTIVLCKIFRFPNLLTENKLPTSLVRFHEQTAELD